MAVEGVYFVCPVRPDRRQSRNGRLGSRIFVALGSDLLGWPGKEIPSVSPEKGLVPT